VDIDKVDRVLTGGRKWLQEGMKREQQQRYGMVKSMSPVI
jgi:hypothetical protein